MGKTIRLPWRRECCGNDRKEVKMVSSSKVMVNLA
jgi:hypothetical protein